MTRFSKEKTLPARRTLRFQLGHGLLEDCNCPFPLKFPLRCLVIRSLQFVALFRPLFVQRNKRELSPTLLPMIPAPFPRQEMIQRRQEKIAKLPSFLVRQP